MNSNEVSDDLPEPKPQGYWLLYLGISGVLHPSASSYSLVFGRDPWEDGPKRYECAPGCDGLKTSNIQDRLHTVLLGNFGRDR